jgi:hypothetical protein
MQFIGGKARNYFFPTVYMNTSIYIMGYTKCTVPEGSIWYNVSEMISKALIIMFHFHW